MRHHLWWLSWRWGRCEKNEFINFSGNRKKEDEDEKSIDFSTSSFIQSEAKHIYPYTDTHSNFHFTRAIFCLYLFNSNIVLIFYDRSANKLYLKWQMVSFHHRDAASSLYRLFFTKIMMMGSILDSSICGFDARDIPWSKLKLKKKSCKTRFVFLVLTKFWFCA